MTNYEIILYQKLMKCIENKQHGNTDESDIQRVLGALYYSWVKGKEANLNKAKDK